MDGVEFLSGDLADDIFLPREKFVNGLLAHPHRLCKFLHGRFAETMFKKVETGCF
jgi:hypothetical protein